MLWDVSRREAKQLVPGRPLEEWCVFTYLLHMDTYAHTEHRYTHIHSNMHTHTHKHMHTHTHLQRQFGGSTTACQPAWQQDRNYLQEPRRCVSVCACLSLFLCLFLFLTLTDNHQHTRTQALAHKPPIRVCTCTTWKQTKCNRSKWGRITT